MKKGIQFTVIVLGLPVMGVAFLVGIVAAWVQVGFMTGWKEFWE